MKLIVTCKEQGQYLVKMEDHPDCHIGVGTTIDGAVGDFFAKNVDSLLPGTEVVFNDETVKSAEGKG